MTAAAKGIFLLKTCDSLSSSQGDNGRDSVFLCVMAYYSTLLLANLILKYDS